MDIPGIKYRIIKHLPAYLLKFGFVDLEGLGRFKLDAHTSYIDYAASQIYPPYYDVVFDQGQFSQMNDYVAYLSRRLGLDDSLIAEVMSVYTSSIKQQLEYRETVNLEGLGTMLMGEDARFNFESDEAYWGKSAIEDLAVSFNPVPRLKDQFEKQSTTTMEDDLVAVAGLTENDEIVEEDVELLEQQWEDEITVEEEQEIPPVEALVGESTSPIVEEIELTNDTIEEERNAEPPYAIEEKIESVKVDNTAVSPNVAVEAPADQYEESKTKHKTILPIMLGLLLLAIPLFWYLVNSRSGQEQANGLNKEIPAERLNQQPGAVETNEEELASDEIERITNIAEEEIRVENSKIETASAESSEPAIEEEAAENILKKPSDNHLINKELSANDKSITSGECVIIVGAYGANANMHQMMKKLEAKGFKVYVDSTRALSRVGAYSTCENDELQRNLSIIKSDIESSSWILNK